MRALPHGVERTGGLVGAVLLTQDADAHPTQAIEWIHDRVEGRASRVAGEAVPAAATALAVEKPVRRQGPEDLREERRGNSELPGDVPRQRPLPAAVEVDEREGPDRVFGAAAQQETSPSADRSSRA